MRVSEQNVSLVLKSAIVNILNGKQSSKLSGLSPVGMENIVLSVPA